MTQLTGLPWEKIHNFLLASGGVRNPRELCIEVVKTIYALVPYDQARIYFVNGNGEICDEVLFGVDKRWSKAYLEYFSKVENGRYNLARGLERYSPFEGISHNWSLSERSEFINDYIKPQGLQYSLGFVLYDADNLTKCVCTFDRTKPSGYTPDEIATLGVVHSHLENLYKNLFVLSLTSRDYQKQIGSEASLTARESEITALLCDGITPANISKKLSLSLSTVYRHIANIHGKLQVSNRQELLLKLLNTAGESGK